MFNQVQEIYNQVFVSEQLRQKTENVHQDKVKNSSLSKNDGLKKFLKRKNKRSIVSGRAVRDEDESEGEKAERL
jgi:hypothetical protein